jgi:hypothetical protein
MVLPRNKQGLVWVMFVILTLFQCMGNMYAAYVSLENYMDWIDMFGLNDMEEISQKRVLAAISGIILPLVALGFIRIMADMLQSNTEDSVEQEALPIGNPVEGIAEPEVVEEPIPEVVEEPIPEVVENPEPVEESETPQPELKSKK